MVFRVQWNGNAKTYFTFRSAKMLADLLIRNDATRTIVIVPVGISIR